MALLVSVLGLLRTLLAGQELALENVALRQQLAVLRRQRPRPSLRVRRPALLDGLGERVASVA